MFILIPFLILFGVLGLFWLVAAGLLVGNLIGRSPRILDKMLDHGPKNCACYLGMKHGHSV